MKGIPTKLRFQHIHIVGKTQTGKTTWMLNLMLRDIKKGRGVGFIDPNGDASKELLQRIPEDRLEDVFYFEPWNYPLGIAPKPENEREITLFTNNFISILKRLSGQSWGERMQAILSHAIPALYRTGYNIRDLNALLIDATFRSAVIQKLDDPALIQFWTKVYPTLPKDSPHSIIFRLTRFDTPSVALPFSASTVSIPAVMDEQKIFIANLSECDPETKSLYGTILVSMFEFGILRRATQPKEVRTPFFLFVDEFQEFATESFSRIVAQAAKFKVALHLAHQRLYQEGISVTLMNDILGIVGSDVVFSVGEREVKYYDTKFGYRKSRMKYAVGITGSNELFIPGEGLSPADLLPYQAIIHTPTGTDTFFTSPLPPVRNDSSSQILARMKELSPKRELVAPPRADAGEPEESPPPEM